MLHLIQLDRFGRTILATAIALLSPTPNPAGRTTLAMASYLLKAMMIPEKVITEMVPIFTKRPANCPAGMECDVMISVKELIPTVGTAAL